MDEEDEYVSLSFRRFRFVPALPGFFDSATLKKLLSIYTKNKNAVVYIAGELCESGISFAMEDIFYGPQSIVHIDNLGTFSKTLTITYDNELVSRSVGNLPIPRTEMYWKKDGRNVTLEAERINDENRGNMTKYFHAIFPFKSGIFTHFDGSVKKYTSDEMRLREGKTINEFDKSSQKSKLFRVDGVAEARDAVGVFTDFFKNPKIWEFFFGEVYEVPV